MGIKCKHLCWLLLECKGHENNLYLFYVKALATESTEKQTVASDLNCVNNLKGICCGYGSHPGINAKLSKRQCEFVLSSRQILIISQVVFTKLTLSYKKDYRAGQSVVAQALSSIYLFYGADNWCCSFLSVSSRLHGFPHSLSPNCYMDWAYNFI